MEEAPKPRQDVIFINYRKMGTGWSANLLATELERIFGEDRVFQDVEGIRAGDRFAVNLEETGSVLFTPPVGVTAIRITSAKPRSRPTFRRRSSFRRWPIASRSFLMTSTMSSIALGSVQ